jgi:hypothetical protein
MPRWVKWVAVITLVLIVVMALRYPILRGLGHALIYEDDLRKADVMFVLSGSPYDRGSEAARLFHQGWIGNKIVCTGAIIPHDLKVLGLQYPESELIRFRLMDLKVPDSLVEVFPVGTSTIEESEAILKYCLEEHIQSIMVVSSKFHTRRIKHVFKRKFRKAGIELTIRGAPSSQYAEATWWKSEGGLLSVNNEYVKMIWYLFN